MAAVQFNAFQDEATRKRLLDIAEVRTTSTGVIKEIVTSAVGEGVDEMARIVRGESNEVYGIHTKQQRDLILRIGHWDKKAFQRESWAIAQAAAIGVPTPKILAMGEHPSSAYYCM